MCLGPDKDCKATLTSRSKALNPVSVSKTACRKWLSRQFSATTCRPQHRCLAPYTQEHSSHCQTAGLTALCHCRQARDSRCKSAFEGLAQPL